MAELKLTDLVARIDQDRLVIPDFQRGFKWRQADIRKLLESLLLDFPIGAALLWRTQRNTLEFRRIEDVEFPEDGEAEVQNIGQSSSNTEEIDFILDGQQRLTSIYKLFPISLAPTDREVESKFNGLRFFLDLRKLGLPTTLASLQIDDLNKFKDPDRVAESIVEKRHTELRKELRAISDNNQVPQRLTEDHVLQVCTRRLWLPLTRALLENKQANLQRLRRVVAAKLLNDAENYSGPLSPNEIRAQIDTGLDQWTDWFTSTFQATLNSKVLTCLIQTNENPEGLARIFETINSTGMNLSVFDLLVARLGTWTKDGVQINLRNLLASQLEAVLLQKFDDGKALGGTASQQVPRALALRVGIELKKGEILKADKKTFLEHIDEIGAGVPAALETLTRHMGIIDHTFVPFKDMIALLIAINAELGADQWERHKDAAIAFLWTACILEDWDSSTNDKTRATFKELQEIVHGRADRDAIAARLRKDFASWEDVRDATSKANITFRTLIAFNLARGGRDWLGQERSTQAAMEDHHIFPKEWLNDNRDNSTDRQLWSALRDSVLNRIFVSKQANLDASAQTPPNYLNKLTQQERRTLQIPESFLGPLPTPIKFQQFADLLRERYEMIRQDFVDYVTQALS